MKKNIIFVNKLNYGGPGTFQKNFISHIKNQKISFTYKEILLGYKNIVFVIAGTKDIFFLLFCKLKGIEIVQRLDGLVWQHRAKYNGLVNFFLSEIRQLIVWFIRIFLADKIIYQSEFIKKCWQDYDYLKKPSIIIYNGSNTQQYHKKKKRKNLRFISVEGDLNCEPMYSILEGLSDLNIDVYGKFDLKRASQIKGKVIFKGPVSKGKVLKVLPMYDVFLTVELLPPCSNSIIEAMSFGLPVFGYKAGSVYELVDAGGLLADYGNNPWKMELPDIKKLRSLLPVLQNNYQKLGYTAWKRHQQKFNITEISKKYIDFCFSYNN